LGSLAWIVVKMILYLVIGAALGFWLLPRLSQKINNLPVSQGLTSFSLVIILLYGWAAEILGGMAAITGAFLAGLILARSPVKERIEGSLPVLAYGLFVPIFFINIGLSTDARELFGASFWLFIAITLVAIIGKVIGAGLGALWAGLSRREALQLGVGMMSRGEVGLIVAAVGISNGMIDQAVFSAVVGVVIVTTLITPPLLRLAFRKPRPKPAVKPPASPPEAPATQLASDSQIASGGEN